MIRGIGFKPGVSINGVQPELLIGLLVAAQVYGARGIAFVVTSVLDGKHMDGSLHYAGKAFDCRLASWYDKEATDDDAALRDELKRGLGDDFDVVLEGDHIHVEYQPHIEPPKEKIA